MPEQEFGKVVIRTPDRREYRGQMLEVRRDAHGRELAVVRLDTGWVTSYPLSMVTSDDHQSGSNRAG